MRGHMVSPSEQRGTLLLRLMHGLLSYWLVIDALRHCYRCVNSYDKCQETSAAASPCVGENRTANTRMAANARRMTPKMANCSTWTPLNHSEITSVSITTRMVSTIKVTLTRPSEK